MPLYDFKCDSCKKVIEHYASMDEHTKDCICGGLMNRIITSRFHIDADYASSDFVTEDITGNPVRITSKKQMRQLCEKNSVSPKFGKGWY